MEATVEDAAAPSGPYRDPFLIAKKKRTKRYRPHSPIPFTISFSAAADHHRVSSEESTTSQEKDTARSLILLSTGHFSTLPPQPENTSSDCYEHPKNKRSHVSAGRLGFATVMYTCKTCNRAFRSFQALGGHRTSHTKSKKEKQSSFDFKPKGLRRWSVSSPRNKYSDSLSFQLSNISTTTTTSKSSPPYRIHECSYCGAEFNSGQALGGHMRRHRSGPVSTLFYPSPPPPITMASTDTEETENEDSKKKKNGLSLDLNLPAPPEDENQNFGLFDTGKLEKSPEERQQRQSEAAMRLVLSSTDNLIPPLVDCHY